MSFVDGATPQGSKLIADARRVARIRGYDPDATRALIDFYMHHKTGVSHHTIGIEGPDGKRYCVGCWWCEGPDTAAHRDERRML